MSSPGWPKNDLDASLEVANTIIENGGQLDSRQLAQFLGYTSPSSGTFSNRIAAAKLFGLIEGQSPRIRATALAQQILQPVEPYDEGAGRVDAFLSVPLFQAFFAEFEGKPLPSGKQGLDNALTTRFGVETKNVARARARLLNSADQAGLFDVAGGRTKMIRPLPGRGSQEVERPDPRITTPAIAPLRSVPKVVQGALETVPWDVPLKDQQIEEVANFVKSAMKLHFGFLLTNKEEQPES